MTEKRRIENDLAKAEKIDFVGGNRILARYQDGSEVLFENVEIHWPSLVRELYRAGYMTKAAARKELRKFGLKP